MLPMEPPRKVIKPPPNSTGHVVGEKGNTKSRFEQSSGCRTKVSDANPDGTCEGQPSTEDIDDGERQRRKARRDQLIAASESQALAAHTLVAKTRASRNATAASMASSVHGTDNDQGPADPPPLPEVSRAAMLKAKIASTERPEFVMPREDSPDPDASTEAYVNEHGSDDDMLEY